jgi:hypothetical protein
MAYLALTSLYDTVNIYRCDPEEYVYIGSLRCDGGGEHVVHCFTHDLSCLVCSLGGRVIKWDITALTSVSSEAPLPVVYDEGSEWVVDIGYAMAEYYIITGPREGRTGILLWTHSSPNIIPY